MTIYVDIFTVFPYVCVYFMLGVCTLIDLLAQAMSLAGGGC